jgi:hypothetical protein
LRPLGNHDNSKVLGASKFNAWIQELEAIDTIRRVTHNEFINMDYAPERCLAVFAGINEIYRIMRPLLKDAELTAKLDKKAIDVRGKCLAYFNNVTISRRNNPMSEEHLSAELWNELDDYFTDIYTIRHELGLGIRKVEVGISEADLKKKMVSEL